MKNALIDRIHSNEISSLQTHEQKIFKKLFTTKVKVCIYQREKIDIKRIFEAKKFNGI